MAKRRFRTRTRRRRVGNGRNGYLVVPFTFTVQAGQRTSVATNLLNIPPGTAWKIQHVSGEVVGGVVAPNASGSNPPGWTPAGVQIEILAPRTTAGSPIVATSSGPLMLGPSPRRFRVRNNRSADFWPADSSTQNAVVVEAICFGSPTLATETISGCLEIHITLRPESVSGRCPTLLYGGPMETTTNLMHDSMPVTQSHTVDDSAQVSLQSSCGDLFGSSHSSCVTSATTRDDAL